MDFFIGRKLSLIFFYIIFILAESEGFKPTYKGYKVFRTYPENLLQLDNLRCLGNSAGNLDFWSEPRALGRSVDVMVPPTQFTRVINHFHRNKISFDVMIEDVQSLIDTESAEEDLTQRASRPRTASQNGIMTWTSYHRLKDIHKYMDDLASRHPQVAQVATIGTTYMKNALKLIKLGTAKNNGRKPAIWIDGGIHAREWISPATATYLIEQLITGYTSNNSLIRGYLDTMDFYILPVANPDGYEHSHLNSRMWRKNRSISSGFTGFFCRGVDLNRNFGFHWNQGGASSRACAENFAGPNSFSEEESLAIAQFILSKKDNIKIFITMHSYGQFWMTPWGYTSDLPDDYQDLAALATAGARAIKKVHGTSYTVGTSTNVLYTASGGSDDWAKGSAGIKYSYTLELRDKGRYGFFLPSSQILPTGQETWEGIKVLADALMNGLQ